MNHFIFKVLLLSLFLMSFQGEKDCTNLPNTFSSYEQASNLVKSSVFKLHENVNTSKSSWIRAVNYYSCDSKKGFLIIKTDQGEYIHQNLPIEVWREFKNASSFGSYYSDNIRGNYKLNLNFIKN